ncbi:MAG TPA: minor capsid protein [Frankiaceae bacterium]|nr:minor capsid protein [Frankiaceae bacterium]
MSAASQTDFLTEYAEGFAQLIAAADIGFSWRDFGTQTDGRAPIFLADVPTGPDVVCTLTPSPMDANPVYTDSAVNLQIRFRAGTDVRQVWALRDPVRKLLAGLFPTRLPTGIYISVLKFAYGTSMGRDASNRWEWADNWRTRATELHS